MRRTHTQALLVALCVVACATGALLVPERGQRFVVPGAYDLRMERTAPGTQLITFRIIEGTPDWAYQLDQSLRTQGWLPPDYSGATAQFTIYTRAVSLGFGTLWEEAEIGGDVHTAHITVRRWLRLPWLRQTPIRF